MSVFAVHTIVHRDGSTVAFAPGDELPEWAVAKVGPHCLSVDAESEPLSGGADDTEDTPAAESAASEDPEESEPTGEPIADVPDFTGSAPAPRRGRPRKQ